MFAKTVTTLLGACVPGFFVVLWPAAPLLAAESPMQAQAQQKAGGPSNNGQDRLPGPRRGMRRRMDDTGRNRPNGPFMNEEERMELRRFMQEHFPRLFEELQRARTRHPQRFKQRMQRMAPEFRRLMMIARDDPDKGALLIRERRYEMSIRRLVRRHHRSDDEGRKDAIRQEITDLAAKLFDCRHERRALEIKTFQLRLKELEERHGEAADTRNQIIARTVEEFLDRNPHRPWGKERNGPARRLNNSGNKEPAPGR